MIKMLRVDDRLLHGQTASLWAPYLGVDTIVVANDRAASDPLMQSVFKMAKPPQVTLSIKSVEGTILVINNPKHAARTIFVICESPADAARIAEACPDVDRICLGSVRQEDDRVRISPQVFLDVSDMDAVGRINELGRDVFLQSVPDQTPMSFAEIQKAFGA